MASIVFIEEDDIGSAWISALRKVLSEGDDIKTEYDKESDLPAKDSTVLIRVKEPFSNPILNKRSREKKTLKVRSKAGNSYEAYGRIEDIFLIGSIQSNYIEEVLDGINDHYITQSAKSFPYSYHDRIYSYSPFALEDSLLKEYQVLLRNNEEITTHEKLKFNKTVKESNGTLTWNLADGTEIVLDKEICETYGVKELPLSILNLPKVNQIELIIQKLQKSPHTRRAQAITWRPYSDIITDDPPCLQRLYFRVKNGKLMLQTTWRSRDLFKAWEANVNAMIRIQKYVADQLGLEVGEYIDFSNSLHIYGRDIKDVTKLLEELKD
ncbi:MAG: thymidylate synthase [Promethearchaeota archaeon]